MAEQLSADAGNEGYRNKYRQQHEGDGEDRAGDLGHRFLAGIRHREIGFFLDHAFDVLDDDDGIVDDNADGKHQRQQRDGVGRISDDQQHGKCTDDGHRHGDKRYQRRPHLAEEQKDHDADKDNSDDKRTHDLDDRRGDEDRGSKNIV